MSHLLAEKGMRPLISTTTRAPRAGEVDGRDYHFMTKDRFNQLLDEGFFIENVEYNNTFYGVSVEEARKGVFPGSSRCFGLQRPHGVQQISDFCPSSWLARLACVCG